MSDTTVERQISPGVKELHKYYKRDLASGDQKAITQAVYALAHQWKLYPDDCDLLAEIVQWHRQNGGCDLSALEALEAHINKYRLRYADEDREPNISESH